LIKDKRKIISNKNIQNIKHKECASVW